MNAPNRVAHALLGLARGPTCRWRCWPSRSLGTIVGILGILKAGGAYCPLDPTWPAERLAALLDDIGPPVIVTQAHLCAKLPERSVPVLLLDRPEGHSEFSAENPNVKMPVDPLAYLPFTSGSTGRPKGVAIRHRSIVRLICENGYARFDSDEVFLHLAPLAFDASTFEIWGRLLHGARLALAPPGMPTLPELGRLLTESSVTTLWLTAGLFQLLVQERLDDLAGLRQTAGWRRRFGPGYRSPAAGVLSATAPHQRIRSN